MIPADLTAQSARLQPILDEMQRMLESRVQDDLRGLEIVSVLGRTKKLASIFQKLHTGKYSSLSELRDLVGLTVVVLHRRDMRDAISAVRSGGLQIVAEPTRAIKATDFAYREPKLYVSPPEDYLDRHPEMEGIVAEIQFTSTLQHALDKTTHDFDYKGASYSWSNFRLVAQLRGMLELVDSMIDEIDSVAVSTNEPIEAPSDVIFGGDVLATLAEVFEPEVLPSDRRRLADTVAGWLTAINGDASTLRVALENSSDLVHAQSVDCASSVLGSLLRFDGKNLVASYTSRFCISAELESLCSETELVPPSQRVTWSSPPASP